MLVKYKDRYQILSEKQFIHFFIYSVIIIFVLSMTPFVSASNKIKKGLLFPQCCCYQIKIYHVKK
jgi:hypothetical protein